MAGVANTQMDILAQRKAREGQQAAAMGDKMFDLAAAMLERKTRELEDYKKVVKEKFEQLEQNLKRQSANAQGYKALHAYLLDEMKKIASPDAVALDLTKRREIFNNSYDEFMRGDKLF